FYERARGSYKQEQMKLTPAQREKFKSEYPKDQLITKTDLAKYYNCYLRKPHIVSRGAQYNMKNFAEYYEKFLAPKKMGQIDTASKIDEKFFKDCIALALIFRKTDLLLQKQDWFPKGSGYKANIVAYAMSKLFDVVEEKTGGKKHVDFNRIWNEQNMYPELASFMMDLCKVTLGKLTDESHGLLNVTEWAKKEACWDEIKKCDVKMPLQFETTLASDFEVKQQEVTAKREKKVENDVNAQITVVKKGPDFWQKILNKCLEKKININEVQQSDLRVAITMYQKRPPNSFESKRLLKFLEYVQEEGIDLENL
ncbi:MAG: AIPR family protein, partial [Candidatus Enteromonas sp.]|nr:AIPR family protein [Candidatus Enteromonas sp.]